MHESLTQKSDRKETKMHETLTQQSDRKEN